ncbi:MAG: hypothetical protein OEM38_08670 [Gammaproteobacteria bacterium]|nr:hypothetical protein [Gammaproteobacteria bacterium]
MSFDEKEIALTFEFDNDNIEEIKEKWLDIVKLLMWGDVSSKKIGALPRSRKRMLEVGESFGSFISSKAWIEQPRQQLKSALGSSVKLRDSLSALGLVNKHITEGSDAKSYQKQVDEIEMLLMALIFKHENLWVNLLESQSYDDE